MMDGLGALIGEVWRSATNVAPGALAVALVLHLLKVAAEARSWHGILRHAYPLPRRLPFRTSLGAFVASIGANAVLPARVGETLRVAIVRRRVPESSIATIAATVALETLLEILFGVAMVVAWIAGGGTVADGATPGRLVAGLAAHPVALLIAGLLLAVAAAAVVRYRSRIRHLMCQIVAGFAILSSPGVFFRGVLAWKAVAWMLRFGSVLAFLAAFHLPAAPLTALAVVAAQTVAGALPLLPGNAGTQQAAIGAALAGTASASVLIGFGLGMQATTTVVDLMAGVIAAALVPGRLGSERRWRLPAEDRR